MNRLPLQLDPAHPDHTGGLRFVGASIEGFLPIGFIVGVMPAGLVVQQVVHHHANPLEFKSVTVGAAILVLLLCAGPLLIFVGRLFQERHRGGLQRGAMRRRWVNCRPDLLFEPCMRSAAVAGAALWLIRATD